MYKWIILMSGLFASLIACAKVKLSPLFSDNMVLQQEAEVPVWGKAISRNASYSDSFMEWGEI